MILDSITHPIAASLVTGLFLYSVVKLARTGIKTDIAIGQLSRGEQPHCIKRHRWSSWSTGQATHSHCSVRSRHCLDCPKVQEWEMPLESESEYQQFKDDKEKYGE